MFNLKTYYLNFLFLIAFFFSLIGHAAAENPSNIAQNKESFRYQGFVNQFGKLLLPTDIEHKYVLVNFIFTECSATCPIQTSQLVSFQRDIPADLRDKVFIISISVNPMDTPKMLLKFAEKYKANLKSWSFLKGENAVFDRLVNEFAAIKPSKNGTRVDFNLHTSDIYLFNSNGVFAQRYTGVPLNSSRIIEDIRVLMSM